MIGNNVTASGPDPKDVFEFRYKIVDLDDLEPSHHANLAPNPNFPADLQPRQRSREASRQQIRKIASKLQPDALIDDFKTLDRGPMIIGPDNVVESGNGRTIALLLAREEFKGKYDEYRNAVRARAAEFGITDIGDIDDPVLVRERLTDFDRKKFTSMANAATVLTMSPVEQALQDSQGITEQSLSGLQVGDSQSIDQALRGQANRPMASGFLARLPENERAALIDGTGNLNQIGLQRLKAAIFTKVFPGAAGQRLTTTFFESVDPQIKTIESSVFDALPKLAKAEGLTRSGQRAADLSLGEDLAKAVDMLARLKQEGMSVEEFLGQTGFFERELTPEQEKILAYLGENARSRKRVRDGIKEYAEAVEAAPHPDQGSLFGGEAQESKSDILDRIFERQRKESTGESIGLFALAAEREKAGFGSGARATETPTPTVGTVRETVEPVSDTEAESKAQHASDASARVIADRKSQFTDKAPLGSLDTDKALTVLDARARFPGVTFETKNGELIVGPSGIPKGFFFAPVGRSMDAQVRNTISTLETKIDGFNREATGRREIVAFEEETAKRDKERAGLSQTDQDANKKMLDGVKALRERNVAAISRVFDLKKGETVGFGPFQGEVVARVSQSPGNAALMSQTPIVRFESGEVATLDDMVTGTNLTLGDMGALGAAILKERGVTITQDAPVATEIPADVKAFTDSTGKDSMAAGRIAKTLARGVVVGGRERSRERSISALVSGGYRVVTETHTFNGEPSKPHRMLKHPETEQFFLEKDFSKIGLDFAEFLGKRADADTRPDSPDVQRFKQLATEAAQPAASKPELVINAPGVSRSDIPMSVAQRAHEGTSMQPERRARQERDGYVEHMENVWKWLNSKTTTDDDKARARDEFENYRTAYVTKYRAILAGRAGIISSFITGPSNFPTRRNQKRLDADHNRTETFNEWDSKARSRMVRKAIPTLGAISSDQANAPDLLQEKIDKAKALQDTMKRANVVIKRKGASKEEKIAALVSGVGLKQDQAEKLMEPDFVGRLGFPAFELTNNLANIKRMEGRVKTIDDTRATPGSAKPFPGGRVVDNAEDNRLQLFFDDKPDEAMRKKMKSRGFRWSPGNGAWQRARGNASMFAVIEVLTAGGFVKEPGEGTPLEKQRAVYKQLSEGATAITPADTMTPATLRARDRIRERMAAEESSPKSPMIVVETKAPIETTMNKFVAPTEVIEKPLEGKEKEIRDRQREQFRQIDEERAKREKEIERLKELAPSELADAFVNAQGAMAFGGDVFRRVIRDMSPIGLDQVEAEILANSGHTVAQRRTMGRFLLPHVKDGQKLRQADLDARVKKANVDLKADKKEITEALQNLPRRDGGMVKGTSVVIVKHPQASTVFRQSGKDSPAFGVEVRGTGKAVLLEGGALSRKDALEKARGELRKAAGVHPALTDVGPRTFEVERRQVEKKARRQIDAVLAGQKSTEQGIAAVADMPVEPPPPGDIHEMKKRQKKAADKPAAQVTSVSQEAAQDRFEEHQDNTNRDLKASARRVAPAVATNEREAKMQQRWMENPGALDFEGVDTKRTKKRKRRPRSTPAASVSKTR